MISWKRVFGVDLVETAIWGVGAFLTTIMVVEYFHDRMPGFATALALLIAFGLRRHAAIRALPPEGESSGAWRLSEVDARLAELELLQGRVAELEERVDFSERLLASKGGPERVEGPR